jgi:hypothetical protein
VIKYDATDHDGQKEMQPETNEKRMVVPQIDSIEDQAGDLVQHMISLRAGTIWITYWKEAFNKLLPFCLPIPNLFRTSLTSPALLVTARFFGLERLLVNPSGLDRRSREGEHSRVDTEGRLTRAGLDAPARPSSASRKSVTPTPRTDRVRLCSERFSIAIRAGDNFNNGEPSIILWLLGLSAARVSDKVTHNEHNLPYHL